MPYIDYPKPTFNKNTIAIDKVIATVLAGCTCFCAVERNMTI